MPDKRAASPHTILYVVTKSNFGGAQRYVYDLARGMHARGHRVAVALGGTGAEGAPRGELDIKLREAGIRTIPVTHFMRDISMTRDVGAFFELKRIIAAERPDVVHASSSKAGGLALCAAALLGVRCRVFTAHGLTFDETWRPHYARALIWLFTWWTVLLSTTSILITRDNLERIATLPGCRGRARFVPNGIEPPDCVARDAARTALVPSISDDRPWIGSIAEYHPNKNLGVLIEAAAQLKARGTDVHLVLIGNDGGDRPTLQALIAQLGLSDRVHLLGTVPQAARYLRAFDMCALPSKKEGLPYVLLEAGHAGCPVVASDIPGIGDIVTNGSTGVLLEPDPNLYCNTFEKLLSDPLLRSRYAEALRAHVEEHFSLGRMIEATETCYALSSNPSIS